MSQRMAVRVGARGSALSLAQAKLVISRLSDLGVKTEFQVISTVGCRKQGTSEAATGDKRNWMHDLELALLANEIDVAIHSAKDVPAEIAGETILLPVLERATASDVFIGRTLPSGTRMKFCDLPEKAVVGTASLRRQAELLRSRSDLQIVTHRGNITTRLEKLDSTAELSGIILAAAGLERIGNEVGEKLPTVTMLPAVNQGILVAHCRRIDSEVLSILQQLRHEDTAAEFELERACITVLEGDCHSAIGCHAVCKNGEVSGTVRVYSVDGLDLVEQSISGASSKAWELGTELGRACLAAGGGRLLSEARIANAKVAEATTLGIHLKA